MPWGKIGGIGGHTDTGFQDPRRFLGREVGLDAEKSKRVGGWMKKEDPLAWQEHLRLQEREQRSRSWALILFPILCLIMYSVTVYYEYKTYPVEVDAALQQQIEEAKAKEAYEYIKDVGFYYLKHNDLEAAQSQFELALRQKPNDVDAHLSLTEILAARCAENGEMCDEAALQLRLSEQLPELDALQVKRLKVVSGLLNDGMD